MTELILNSCIDELKWDENGLIPAIAQDEQSGRILMFAWMNRDSLTQTLEKGQAVYWSRSRKKLWAKGKESGNSQKIKSIHTALTSRCVPTRKK